MSKKDIIVDFILRQRKNGWLDGKIRDHMEFTQNYTPEMLNNYFTLADRKEMQKLALKIGLPVVIILIFGLGLLLGPGNILTGAAPADTSKSSSTWPWSTTTYDCGDEVPTDDIMDISDCLSDEEDYKTNLFCYVDESISVNDISPDEGNDDWYLDNLGIVIDDYRTTGSFGIIMGSINSLTLGGSLVFPYNDDDHDCAEWNHGLALDSDWHACVDDDGDDVPDNLVFYYLDGLNDDDVGYGHLGTDLTYDGSYYLCFDELECETSTSECEDGSYCVGRLDDTESSAYYPCDTNSTTADYYRCCTGSCEGISMSCGGYLLSQDETESAEFEECTEDGTSACCDSSTACVYDGECYEFYETTDINELTITDINELTMICSWENTWCVEGSEYDSDYDICRPMQEACYDSDDEDYCSSTYGSDDIDTWEADSGCVQEDPDCDSTSGSCTSYYEGCIYKEVSGMDYYFYQDIKWY